MRWMAGPALSQKISRYSVCPLPTKYQPLQCLPSHKISAATVLPSHKISAVQYQPAKITHPNGLKQTTAKLLADVSAHTTESGHLAPPSHPRLHPPPST